MNRVLTIVLENEDLLGPALEWPLRLAGRDGAMVTLLVATDSRVDGNSAKVDLVVDDDEDEVERRCAARVRETLDVHVGEGKWSAEPPPADDAAGDAPPAFELRIGVRFVPPDGIGRELDRLAESARPSMVVFVAHPERRKEWRARVEAALPHVTCESYFVVPTPRETPGGIVVAAGDTVDARAAIVGAHGLAQQSGRRLTALFIEPDIGADAPAVGRRLLDTALEHAEIDPGQIDMRRRVVVSDVPESAVVETANEAEYEVLVCAADASGRGDNATFGPVVRAELTATLVVVRGALPLSADLSRRVRAWVERRVPQLEREDRIDLMTRIQSNSDWNFDFVALMALASLIAAMGLIDDSAAVIIGAMLVAPLMTPLLGFALALVQRNARLARMTAKSVAFGFATAFGLSIAIAWIAGIEAPSSEMNGRDTPQTLDAIIAFASGLAAAYASARPGLIGALPGVAIAAALVPPIVTAGLATYLRLPELAWGALLLFGVNMILIVVAATFALWAVGIRAGKREGQSAGVTTAALAVATAFMAVVIALGPKAIWVDASVRSAIANAVPKGYVLRDIAPDPRLGRNGVVIHLAGLQPPSDDLVRTLIEDASALLGDAVGTIELTFAYEIVESPSEAESASED